MEGNMKKRPEKKRKFGLQRVEALPESEVEKLPSESLCRSFDIARKDLTHKSLNFVMKLRNI